MQFVDLPHTDLRVSPLCLGTVGFGASIPPPQAEALFDAFVALGGNFIDTAAVYSDWLPVPKSITEKTIGAWLIQRGLHSKISIATKGAHPDLASMHVSRLSPADIIGDLNQSLLNLQTDVIDIYWLHRDDRSIPVGEIIDPLHEQVIAGKIRYFGCSNWYADRIEAAQQYAAQHGIQGFVANQPMWSLAAPAFDGLPDKTITVMDAAALALHRRTRLPAIPYSSQAHGFFTKLERSGKDSISAGDRAIYYNDANLRRFEQAKLLARDHGVSINAIALSYLRSQPFVTVPIIGSKSVDQLEDSFAAVDLILSPEEVARLEGA